MRLAQPAAPRLRRRSSPHPRSAYGDKGHAGAQTLERQLRPGEVSLDELERAFRETATEVAHLSRRKPPAPRVEGP